MGVMARENGGGAGSFTALRNEDGTSVVGPQNECCFCLTLRLGTIIIGFLNSFINLLLFLGYIVLFNSESSWSFNPTSKLEIGILTIFLLQIFVNILLIYGAFNKIPNQTLPWLYTNVGAVLLLVVFVILLLFIGYVRLSINKNEHIFYLVFAGIAGALHTFFCFVVFQFRKNLIEEQSLLETTAEYQAPSAPFPHPGHSSPPPSYEEASRISKGAKSQMENDEKETSFSNP